jgi:hypothetical protein
MSDYFDFPPNDWDGEEEENPFRDLPGWDDTPELEDPYVKATEDIMDTLGIESFDDIIFDLGDIEPDTLRGNRFESLEDAITYLFDSGLLRFSGVVLDGEEIEISIDPDTQTFAA